MYKPSIKNITNYRGAYAEIDYQALAKNIQQLQKNLSADSFFCPMVKANAYGHGDVQMTLWLEELGIKNVGVCCFEEAIYLREQGIQSNILFFSGFQEKNIKEVIHYQLTPVIGSWDQLKLLQKNPKISFHLKFDTGMARVGFDKEDAPSVADFLTSLYQNHSEGQNFLGICSHLLQSDENFKENCYTYRQIDLFKDILKFFVQFRFWKPHLLNTAGIEQMCISHHPHFLYNQSILGARPGLGVYGYGSLAQSLNLHPVMSFRSRLLNTRRLKKGRSVSYSARWTAAKESLVAVVQAGYGDGYNRLLTNQGEVLFCGHRVPVVGTVCMDYFLIDITALQDQFSIEEMMQSEVTLWGYDSKQQLLSVQEIAQKINTIPWEVLTQLNARVPRYYKKGDS